MATVKPKPPRRKPGRVRWIVQYSKTSKYWLGQREGLTYVIKSTKAACVAQTADFCEIEWREKQQRSELLIRNKDGTFRTPRTYGDDPRKSKG